MLDRATRLTIFLLLLSLACGQDATECFVDVQGWQPCFDSLLVAMTDTRGGKVRIVDDTKRTDDECE